MPMTSWAPRLAEMKASPAIQAGIARPERKKSCCVRMTAGAHQPIAEHEPEVDDQNGVIDGAELNLGHGRLYGDVVAGDAVRGLVALTTSPRILTASWSCSAAR